MGVMSSRLPSYTNLIQLSLRYWLGVCLVVGPWLALAGESETDAANPSGYEYEFAALGTRVSLQAFHADEGLVERTFLEAEQRVRELESILSDYRADSETRQLSELASQKPVSVSAPLWSVLLQSEKWYQLSDGAFDSSLGSLTKLWRRYRRRQQVPPQDLVQQALAQSGWSHVQLDHTARTVHLANDKVQFDFGGIGKGFIIDEVFQLLHGRGLTCCMVNISGNLRVGEAPAGRTGWRIEIAPAKPGAPALRRIELRQQAIATSGDLWQYVEVNGVRYSHILNPQTGMGVPGPITATAVAGNATDADAMATAACILNSKRALEIAGKLGIELLVAKAAENELEVLTTAKFPAALP